LILALLSVCTGIKCYKKSIFTYFRIKAAQRNAKICMRKETPLDNSIEILSIAESDCGDWRRETPLLATTETG